MVLLIEVRWIFIEGHTAVSAPNPLNESVQNDTSAVPWQIEEFTLTSAKAI